MASMSLVDMITAPLKQITGQMHATDSAAASLSSRALGLAKSLLPIALAAGVLLAALAPCISTAADFEAAMANVGAVSRATPQDMRELSGAPRRDNPLPHSPDQGSDRVTRQPKCPLK